MEENIQNISPKRLCRFLQSTFLFKDISSEKVSLLLSCVTPRLLAFSADEIIFSPGQFDKKMGFVFSGECVVERVKSGHPSLLLNTLGEFDSFGVLTLFSAEEKYPTSVRTKRASTILFFERGDVMTLIEKESQIAINLLEFMGGRISFLNAKIATFSGDNVEQKVVSYLIELQCSLGNRFKFNCKKASEALNIGRASLYRILSSLSDEGLITFENKIIYINNPEGLERKLK